MKITNEHGLSLPMAVWLLHDDYDYNTDPAYISATSLLKSTKQIILGKRISSEDRTADISDFLAQRFGHAVHDSQEKAWRMSGKQALKRLGYPESVYENIAINPTEDYLKEHPECIPIWLEKRSIREITINGKVVKIGGKFDQVMEGKLFDSKTTSVWGYLNESKDDDHSMQGSIYRWLNPEIITDDFVNIQFVFTDWSKMMMRTVPNYPKIKAVEKVIPLHSLEDTEKFIRAKLSELLRLWDAPEEQMPPCTDKELWRSDPKFKYYSDPEKAKDPNARSTKNFDTLSDANAHMASKGGKGIVVTVPGEAKACGYCPAFDGCKQKDAYYAE